MSKTTNKTADNVEFPTFDTSKATDQFRAFAEQGVEQSKETYNRIKANVETTQKAFENAFESARSAGSELSLKGIAAMRANADASFSHLEALVGVKSLSELIELQTSFLRKQVERSVDQAKDIQAVSSKAAEEVAKPMKSMFENAVKELKVA
jgi:phasin